MPPTSSLETDQHINVLRPKSTNNNNNNNNNNSTPSNSNMCLSTPSDSTTPSVCETATTCNNLADTTTTNKCTSTEGASSCNLRHRTNTQPEPLSGSCPTSNKNALEDSNNNKNQNELDLSEEHKKNETYRERTSAQASAVAKKTDDTSVVYKPRLRYPDLIAQIFIHAGALYGIYLLFYARFYTLLWALVTIWCSGVGITAGVHRLWSHKSYTAALPLRLLLIFLFTISGQRDAYTWALDHRIHHKFSETNADPHDARRGFFFAHVGWLFLTPRPEVEEKRKVIDMSDLENDKVVMFQKKWYIPMFALISIAFPVFVPYYFWNENLWMSFWINFNMRFCATLNIAFFVNSVAHMWGRKPYDKNISPVESPIVSFLAMGEGWHNYHHVFPWDYKTSELGTYTLNVTTGFLDFCAKIGWVSGRKMVSPDMVARRAAKCGDGSHFLCDAFAHKDQVWGFGDKDVLQEDAVELANMKD